MTNNRLIITGKRFVLNCTKEKNVNIFALIFTALKQKTSNFNVALPPRANNLFKKKAKILFRLKANHLTFGGEKQKVFFRMTLFFKILLYNIFNNAKKFFLEDKLDAEHRRGRTIHFCLCRKIKCNSFCFVFYPPSLTPIAAFYW